MHEMARSVFWKNTKNIISLSSGEFALRVVKVMKIVKLIQFVDILNIGRPLHITVVIVNYNRTFFIWLKS